MAFSQHKPAADHSRRFIRRNGCKGTSGPHKRQGGPARGRFSFGDRGRLGLRLCRRRNGRRLGWRIAPSGRDRTPSSPSWTSKGAGAAFCACTGATCLGMAILPRGCLSKAAMFALSAECAPTAAARRPFRKMAASIATMTSAFAVTATATAVAAARETAIATAIAVVAAGGRKSGGSTSSGCSESSSEVGSEH